MEWYYNDPNTTYKIGLFLNSPFYFSPLLFYLYFLKPNEYEARTKAGDDPT